MQLDPEAILRKVNFYRAYAATCAREGRDSTSLSNEDGRTSRTSPSSEELLMESASTYRKAASWALLLDPLLSAQLLRHASDAFIQLNFGYGVFLAAVIDRVRLQKLHDRPSNWEQEAEFMMRSVERLQSTDGRASREVPEPMRHPQQQVYAALASAVAEGESHRLLASSVAERSGQLGGVLPVGALGTPIRRFWAIVIGLLSGDVGMALAHIGAMADRFADQAESAMSDPVLWRMCHADFEAVDVDIVGLTALLCRRFSRDEVIGMAEERQTFHSRIGRSQMLLAVALDELSTFGDG